MGGPELAWRSFFLHLCPNGLVCPTCWVPIWIASFIERPLVADVFNYLLICDRKADSARIVHKKKEMSAIEEDL